MAPAIVVRAAAVITNGELVLLHRRRSESVWALPGGRVQAGESAAAAVVRELAEELGEPATVQRLAFVVENTFTHEGNEKHELGLYFVASFSPGASVCSKTGPFAGIEPNADLEFCWFARGELGGLNVRPSFLISALAAPELEFAHVVVGPGGTEA